MIKLSFNSTTLRNIELFEALRQIKEHGYDGVELTLNDSHLHPLRHTRERVSEVTTFCRDNDIEIVCIAAGGPNLLGNEDYEPSLIHPDSQKREQRLDVIKRCIELTNEMNVPVLNINSGKLRNGVSDSEANQRLHEAMEILLPLTGDLIIVLEPEPDFFIGTSTAGVSFIREINSPKLRLNLDIGHVFCSEDNCYENIEMALPYSRHIHIEDIKANIHHHEIPGEGDIDFSRILFLVKQSGYDYYLSVELHHHDAVWERALQESRDFLLKLL